MKRDSAMPAYALLAEDDPFALTGATIALEAMGFEVIQAETFDDALVHRDRSDLQLIVCDLALRYRGQRRAALDSTAGLELMDSLRAKHPELAFVIWTAYPDLLPHPTELIQRFGYKLACVAKGSIASEFREAIDAAMHARLHLEAPAKTSVSAASAQLFLEALPEDVAQHVLQTASLIRARPLHAREQEVARLIMLSPEVAASRMGLQMARSTIDGYRSDLYVRLKLSDGQQVQGFDRRSMVLLTYLYMQLQDA